MALRVLLSRVLVLVVSWLSLAGQAAAAPQPDDGNIHINADAMSRDETSGMYTAEGHVVVLWQETTLLADTVIYAVKDHRIRATGSVVLTKGNEILKGDTLILDTESGRAEVTESRFTSSESGVVVTSRTLERVSDTRYNATATELTTCDMPDPSWKFGADTLAVNTLGYATGRHVVFYIKDVPVLYLPWIAFPVVLEKRSGVLFPRFSKSSSRGYQFDLPLYWVISPSQDLQLDLDVMSRRGVGVGADYRYIRTRGSEGRLGSYAVYDQLEDRWRWQVSQEHKELFTGDANLRTSVNASGDRSFAADFGEKSGDYNRQANNTVINGLKLWRLYEVHSYLNISEDLYAPDNRATVQVLPALGASGVRQQLFTIPLYLDVDSVAENLYRDQAPSGQRLQLFPRITLLPWAASPIHTTVTAGAHLRAYATGMQDNTVQASDGDVLPHVELGVSSSLAKVYDVGYGQLKKVRHELVPELSYRYVPLHDQQRLPFYDYLDRQIQQNMLSLAVTSTLNGKFVADGVTEYRDLSRIKLTGRYSLAGERRDLLTLVDTQHPWSDLLLESETWLLRTLRIRVDGRYNFYEHDLSTLATGFEYDDRQGHLVGVAYQMAKDTLEYFEGHFSTKLAASLTLSYLARYSFDRSDFLESVYGVEYRQKCWSVTAAIHQRPGDQAYTVNFNLAGLSGK